MRESHYFTDGDKRILLLNGLPILIDGENMLACQAIIL
jgi:hypothetical protein